MQPQINNSTQGSPANGLLAEFSATQPAPDPAAGSLFAEEFERASQSKGGTVAESRHADRRQSESALEARGDRKEMDSTARSDAQSGRAMSDQARGERSAKRANLREEQGSDAPGQQVGQPTNQNQQLAKPSLATRGEALSHPGNGPMAENAEANGSAGQLESQQASAAQAAAGAQAAQPGTASQPGTGSQASSSSQAVAPRVAMAANPGGPSSQGQGSPMGQRDLATSGFAAGAQAADAPPSVDAMERLILEREQKMEREAGILRQLKAQLSPGNREISMQLSPAALGKVSMKLAMREGRMTASMVTETKEALEALENQLPELKAALEAQGFEVVDFKLELGANLGDEPGFHSDQQLAAPREMTGSLAAGLAGQAPDQRAENTASKNASSAAASRRGGVDAWG